MPVVHVAYVQRTRDKVSYAIIPSRVTASHPNSEVKLDRDDVVLPSGRGWEGSLSHILRLHGGLIAEGADPRSRALATARALRATRARLGRRALAAMRVPSLSALSRRTALTLTCSTLAALGPSVRPALAKIDGIPFYAPGDEVLLPKAGFEYYLPACEVLRDTVLPSLRSAIERSDLQAAACVGTHREGRERRGIVAEARSAQQRGAHGRHLSPVERRQRRRRRRR